MARRSLMLGALFCAPVLVGLCVFTLYPVLASFYYSFTRYSVMKPPVWVGGANYRHLAGDELFWKSLANTTSYAAIAVPLGILVALGRGGLDKRRRGDARTPLGTYAFGEPRRSPRFGTFIPIDYPTPEQVARGFTGGGLGVHGPPRGWKDPVAARVLDWTTGCIATGTDQDVERIARFVREHRPAAVIR
jgi:murein L,D-transpeptidase YafK